MNRFMKWVDMVPRTAWVFLGIMSLWLVALSVLAGCSGLPQEQYEFGRRVLEDQLATGQISKARFDELLLILNELRDGVDWKTFVGGLVGSVITALTGVRAMRGASKPLPKEEVAVLREIISDYKANKEATNGSH